MIAIEELPASAEISPEAPGPRIIANSVMWQSAEWSQAIDNVLTEDEIASRDPRPSSFRTAWRLFRRRREADVVVVQGPASFFYGLFDRLIPWGRRPWVVREVFLPEANPASISWRLKRAVRRFAYRRMAGMAVCARSEQRTCAEYFRLPEERFRFVPFHTNILKPRHEPEGLYGFAAGRSERDYRTFFEAVRNLAYRFMVVADRASITGCEIPANVELHCDVPREKYLSLLRNAAFVVVPLHQRIRSLGQVVVLEAYAYGKPVVVTRTRGIVDYVQDGRTGLLCDAYDPEDMRRAITALIDDPDRRQACGRNALALVEQEYTFDAFVRHSLEFVHAIAAEQGKA